MEDFIRGAYDLHLHTAPDILPRKIDDIEMVQRAVKSKMGGFAIKSHFFCTADRAKLINKYYMGIQAIGSLCLNHSSGGLNPYAVEMAGRSGAKIIWFPTVDSSGFTNMLNYEGKDVQPYWMSVKEEYVGGSKNVPTIKIIENGKLVNDVYEILDIIARYGMILATGHLTIDEAFMIVKAAKERNVERIIITHVSLPITFYCIDLQIELLKYGAFMEHCIGNCITGKTKYEVLYSQIMAIGAQNVILSSDLGNPNYGYPDENLLQFCSQLSKSGMSFASIRKMTVDNPLQLIQ